MRLTSSTREKTTGRPRLRKKRLFFLLALILLIAVLLSGIHFLSSFQALQNRADWAKSLRTAPQTDSINYLLYGLVDNNEETTIKEMFFLNYPASGGPFHIIFIPGEILLHRLEEKNGTFESLSGEENGEKGLKPFYTPSHFYNEGGAELLIKQISFFLDAPVHHYLEANYTGIPGLVDHRGGIPYKGYVLKGQDYFDYFLKGESKEEPLEKALRRVSSLGNLVKFLGEKKGITSISRIIREASPYFKTDLSWKELKEFHENLEPLFNPQGLIIQLPGSWRDLNGESFFEPNYSQLAMMMENLGKEFILPRELITVQVLNGSGVAGIASKVGELLRGEGFQVIKVDNADSFEYQCSRVISHFEQIEPAKEIAMLIPGAEFFKEPSPDHPVMITVIIGKNFSL